MASFSRPRPHSWAERGERWALGGLVSPALPGRADVVVTLTQRPS